MTKLKQKIGRVSVLFYLYVKSCLEITRDIGIVAAKDAETMFTETYDTIKHSKYF